MEFLLTFGETNFVKVPKSAKFMALEKRSPYGILMLKRFADIVITDITAGQINHYFAEIVPRTVYPLYGINLSI